jgi:hypothetical protein
MSSLIHVPTSVNSCLRLCISKRRIKMERGVKKGRKISWLEANFLEVPLNTL